MHFLPRHGAAYWAGVRFDRLTHLLVRYILLGLSPLSLVRKLHEVSPRCHGGAVSIGNFDGVHRGHAALIERLREMADRNACTAVVFTFDPPPVQILRPELAPAPLTTIEQRARLLLDHGADIVIAYPTDRALLALTPQEFFDEVVVNQLKASALVEGPNFRFGRDRTGDVQTLQKLAGQASVRLDVVEPCIDGVTLVSTSRIRDQLARGQVDEAARGLGRPYAIEGTVCRGAGRGRELGFPTANLGRIATLVPRNGVYAGRVWLDDRIFAAAVNVGPNPTFDDDTQKVEVHLIDFEGNLYDRVVRVEFLDRLRETRAYASADELAAQLRHDIQKARKTALLHQR